MSSFKMVRVYAPAVASLPQPKLLDQVVHAHQEQDASWALRVLERSNTSNFDFAENVSHDDNVNYFKLGPMFCEWYEAYVRELKKIYFFSQLV